MALVNAFGALGLEATQKAIQRGAPDHEQRFEWQAVGGENKPLYIGVAPAGTPSDGSGWQIQRFTYGSGPAGGYLPAVIQTRAGTWDGRDDLTW